MSNRDIPVVDIDCRVAMAGNELKLLVQPQHIMRVVDYTMFVGTHDVAVENHRSRRSPRGSEARGVPCVHVCIDERLPQRRGSIRADTARAWRAHALIAKRAFDL